MFKRFFSSLTVFVFFLTSVIGPNVVHAQALMLPQPGAMIGTSPAFMPVIMKGLKVHPENPLLFDFILDTGDSSLKVDGSAFREESDKLIKYFLASLTIRETDLWVNLSPYEKDRMMTPELGETVLGRDMLAQDYILKQLTASLVYPEKELGKTFWDRVYARAQEQYGTTDVPVDTFNKVWIVADKAKVLEYDNAAYVVGSHLKVMLENDYQAAAQQPMPTHSPAQELANNIIREVIIPEIEKEVNQGEHFAALRQMFHSMILASWYKKALKEALLNQVYTNQGKTGGVLADDPSVGEKIYAQYLEAYKKGVFNYIKEDVNAVGADSMSERTPRKYFSGGEDFTMLANGPEVTEDRSSAKEVLKGEVVVNVQARLDQVQAGGDKVENKIPDEAQLTPSGVNKQQVVDPATLSKLAKKLKALKLLIKVYKSDLFWIMDGFYDNGFLLSLPGLSSLLEKPEVDVFLKRKSQGKWSQLEGLVDSLRKLRSWEKRSISDNPFKGHRFESVWRDSAEYQNEVYDLIEEIVRLYNKYLESLSFSNPFGETVMLTDIMEFKKLVEKGGLVRVGYPTEELDLMFAPVWKDVAELDFGDRDIAVVLNDGDVYYVKEGTEAHKKILKDGLPRRTADQFLYNRNTIPVDKKRIYFPTVRPSTGVPLGKTSFRANITDAAMLKGGIDLNAGKMELDVAGNGKKLEMKIDPAMVAEFQQGNFSGVVPVIIQITPILNPLMTLGLYVDEVDVQRLKG